MIKPSTQRELFTVSGFVDKNGKVSSPHKATIVMAQSDEGVSLPFVVDRLGKDTKVGDQFTHVTVIDGDPNVPMHIDELPAAVRKALREVFKQTGCMDLYGGNVEQMLNVIKSCFDESKTALHKFRRVARDMGKI